MSRLLRMKTAVLSVIMYLMGSYVAVCETSVAAGYRIWLAEWEESRSLGTEPLHMLYYNMNFETWNVFLLGGYGDGWDGDAERVDVQFSILRNIELGTGVLRIGGGWHYIDIDILQGQISTTWQGPEVSASYYQSLGDNGLGMYATTTVLPYVQWEVGHTVLTERANEGTTLGYSLDLGVSAVLKAISCSAGYRHFALEKDEGDIRGGTTIEETFSGFYAQAGTTF